MSKSIILVCLVLAALGCTESEGTQTQLLVTVHAGSKLATRLQRVSAFTVPADARARPAASEIQEFSLSKGASSGTVVSWPFSFGVAKGSTAKVLLVVEGYDSSDPKAASVVEHKLIAAFEDGVTRQIAVELADACADHVCGELQSTCSPDAAASCSDVQSGAVQLTDAGMDAAMPMMKVPAVKPDAGKNQGMRTDNTVMVTPPQVTTPMTNKQMPPQDMPVDPADMDAGPDLPSGACAQANSCSTPDYPCVETTGGGYTCQGRFADWPMPDAAKGAKFAPSYDYQTIPDVVIDLVTHLEWQRAVVRKYPGCSGNVKMPGDTCTWKEAKAYCSQLDLAGGGWRLPSKIELESLQGDTSHAPPVDFAAFPDLSAADVFWTKSPLTNNEDMAWVARSGLGFSLPEDVLMTRSVRCVRGVAAIGGTPREHYQTNQLTNSVTDIHTKLEWQRDYADADSVDEAREYCANKEGEWRLPGLNELLSLIDPLGYEPAVDPVFPALPLGGMFWTATPMISGTSQGDQTMAVDFSAGMTSGDKMLRENQTTVRITFHVRCVR